DVAPQHDLLAPLALALGQLPRRDGQELREQRPGLRELDQRLAGVRLEVDVEDHAGRGVPGANAHVRLERDDAGRQARQDDLEAAARALDLLLARAGRLASVGEALLHVVERVDQEADLVAGRHRQARIEVAARDGPRALHELLYRPDEPA